MTLIVLKKEACVKKHAKIIKLTSSYQPYTQFKSQALTRKRRMIH